MQKEKRPNFRGPGDTEHPGKGGSEGAIYKLGETKKDK